MLVVTFVLYFGLARADLPHPLSDEYIQIINSNQNSWIAGRNYPEDTPLEHLKGRLGAFLGRDSDFPIITHESDFIASLPENFDPREKWLNCPSLHEIRDQGICGSCWAHGAVEAMTDRWCIHSNGSQFHFSSQDMVGCCSKDNGCHGGWPGDAWNFWKNSGLVSGGNYKSNEGCQPYTIPECIHGHDSNSNCTYDGIVPCVKECRDGYGKSYQDDKRFGLKPYHVVGEDNIKAELYKNGPLEVDFTCCPDLFHYKKGVYRLSVPINHECGGHAVKLLGWGVENGTKYWLLANSWNTYWGELGGFFKFLRGENHLGIEEDVFGGLPKLQ
ncbi:cathepsin B-like [Plodia interpunctella]|uniref:cathepsin B-like n=1 Tax=Plodia interpunctella TaxID=58824 RepID=UPI00236766B9|nr:cathepsin B-like [Plodia interpunctella]